MIRTKIIKNDFNLVLKYTPVFWSERYERWLGWHDWGGYTTPWWGKSFLTRKGAMDFLEYQKNYGDLQEEDD